MVAPEGMGTRHDGADILRLHSEMEAVLRDIAHVDPQLDFRVRG